MFEIVDRTCEFCGNKYRNVYKHDGKYEYSIPTRFCSKSCAAKHQKPVPDKNVIEDEIRNFIKIEDRYCCKEEILEAIKRSSKTISKHQIKIVDLNEELGYKNNKSASFFQNKVETILKDVYSNVEIEKTFEGLKSKKGYPLRVDFYIPEINAVVEADGPQHTDETHFYNKDGLVKENDSIKENF